MLVVAVTCNCSHICVLMFEITPKGNYLVLRLDLIKVIFIQVFISCNSMFYCSGTEEVRIESFSYFPQYVGENLFY